MLTFRRYLGHKAIKRIHAKNPTFDPDAPVPIRLEISDEPVLEQEERKFLAKVERCWEMLAMHTAEERLQSTQANLGATRPTEKKSLQPH